MLRLLFLLFILLFLLFLLNGVAIMIGGADLGHLGSKHCRLEKGTDGACTAITTCTRLVSMPCNVATKRLQQYIDESFMCVFVTNYGFLLSIYLIRFANKRRSQYIDIFI